MQGRKKVEFVLDISKPNLPETQPPFKPEEFPTPLNSLLGGFHLVQDSTLHQKNLTKISEYEGKHLGLSTTISIPFLYYHMKLKMILKSHKCATK